ncbi:hypothetical protein [uncultured Methanomethylovorans sp.]|uniref:hypothetical protein n=1 Tax=uncultured Methanomethylovorans sp. TaxID=183759 RepID=UPI002AA84BD1|nr:hypothetical protein [uncultured Methanomethylovorans sp.]
MGTALKIRRETEYYNGCIRFKIAVDNDSFSAAIDVMLDIIFDDKLLHIIKYDHTVKNGKFDLGNIFGKNAKTLTIVFEPLSCSKAADIKCQVTYSDHEGNMNSQFMDPKTISVVCPMMKTDSDINIGRLKELVEQLPTRGSRIYDIQSDFEMAKLTRIVREVIEKRDVKCISTLNTPDKKQSETWYYGKTIVTKEDIVLKISILTEDNTLELFAATQTIESHTGLLADIGPELKDAVESKISGKGKTVLNIGGSIFDRSTLLDFCNKDGTCDTTINIEGCKFTRSTVGVPNNEYKYPWQQEKKEEQESLQQQEEEQLIKQREKEEQIIAAEESKRKREEQTLLKVDQKKQLQIVEEGENTPVYIKTNTGSYRQWTKKDKNKLTIKQLLPLGFVVTFFAIAGVMFPPTFDSDYFYFFVLSFCFCYMMAIVVQLVITSRYKFSLLCPNCGNIIKMPFLKRKQNKREVNQGYQVYRECTNCGKRRWCKMLKKEETFLEEN